MSRLYTVPGSEAALENKNFKEMLLIIRQKITNSESCHRDQGLNLMHPIHEKASESFAFVS